MRGGSYAYLMIRGLDLESSKESCWSSRVEAVDSF